MRARCIALLFIISILTACTAKATIPSPPSGYVPPPKIPTSLADCDWPTVKYEVLNRRQPPSSTTLNCMVLQALDPDTSYAIKQSLLAGHLNKELLNDIVKMREQYPFFKFSVQGQPERDKQGNYTVNVNIDAMTSLLTLPATIEYDHGRWKLSRNLTCSIIGMMQSDPAKVKKDLITCLGPPPGFNR